MLLQVFRDLLADRRSRGLLALARSAYDAGSMDEAERLCDECLRMASHVAELHHLRGTIALKRGDARLAATHLSRAAELHDGEATYHAEAGEVLQQLGAHEAVVRHLSRALELLPASDARRAEILIRLGQSSLIRGEIAAAERALREALALVPDQPDALLALASLLFSESEGEEARRLMDRYVALRGDSGARLRRALMMPVILESNGEIDRLRAHFDEDMERLLAEPLPPIARPETEVGLTAFYLAYQGRDNTARLAKFGRVCRRLYPARTSAAHPSRRGSRLRIGFVSTFFYGHSVGRTTYGLIKDLPREHFDVHVFAVMPRDDAMAAEIRSAADTYVALPEDLESARAAIEAAALDVLLFADIGMHPMTTFLALWRLAPLQLTTWGHSVTSGIDTVDYYASSDAIELSGAEARYTEKLLRLPGYFMPRYHRPQLGGAAKSREELGLPKDKHLYFCPQSLFKIHPDFDPALKEILQRDPLAEIVLLNSRASWMERLRARLARTIGPDAGRVRFLPTVPQRDFVHCLAAADAIIDPFHFGGCNTSAEALGLGVPIVTLPSFQLPGRFTLGLYREIEMDECIARDEQHFVELAVRMGTDADYRRTISAQIAERAPRLFERPDAGQALGAELVRLAETRR